MKKKYNRPDIFIFPTKTHISTLTPEEPEKFDQSRRNVLIKGGLIATVGHISLYGGTDTGPKSAARSNGFVSPSSSK